jgi:hypothetical protein
MVRMGDSKDKVYIGDIVDNRDMATVGDIDIHIDTVLGMEMDKGNYFLVLCFVLYVHNNYSILWPL